MNKGLVCEETSGLSGKKSLLDGFWIAGGAGDQCLVQHIQTLSHCTHNSVISSTDTIKLNHIFGGNNESNYKNKMNLRVGTCPEYCYWCICIGSKRGIVGNNDYSVSGAVNNDAANSESIGDSSFIIKEGEKGKIFKIQQKYLKENKFTSLTYLNALPPHTTVQHLEQGLLS